MGTSRSTNTQCSQWIDSPHHYFIFFDRATTSQEAWKILASTYVIPSRGHIKQVKASFKALTKSSLNILDFIHSVKARVDELAMLDVPRKFWGRIGR